MVDWEEVGGGAELCHWSAYLRSRLIVRDGVVS